MRENIKHKTILYLADIRRPIKKLGPFPPENDSPKKNYNFHFIIILIMLAVSVAGTGILNIRESAIGSASEFYKNFISNSVYGFNVVANFSDIFSPIFSISELASLLRDFDYLSHKTMKQELLLKKEWRHLIKNDGEKLLSNIKNLRENLEKQSEVILKIKNKTAATESRSVEIKKYLDIHKNIAERKNFLAGAIDLLENENIILALFSDEKSYALIRISRGQIRNVDILEADYGNNYLNNENEKYFSENPLLNFLKSRAYAGKEINFAGAIILPDYLKPDIFEAENKNIFSQIIEYYFIDERIHKNISSFLGIGEE